MEIERLKKLQIPSECYVCTNTFDNETFRAVRWFCNHYTCDSCFIKIRDNEISAKCPYCRRSSFFLGQSVAVNLYDDVALKEMIKEMALLKTNMQAEINYLQNKNKELVYEYHNLKKIIFEGTDDDVIYIGSKIN